MHTLQAIITGSIQGLSEFLPISSSAHIVFSNELYNLFTNSDISNINLEEEIFFSIIIHLATLLAVVLYFFKDLKEIIFGFIKSLKTKTYSDNNFKLVIYIALSTIITGIIGLLIKNPAEKLVENPQIICFFLFFTGLILIFSEKFYNGNKELSLKTVILIAIAQGLAVLPGFSRSGLTIATALFLGMNRVKAARFSFLMSIPVIFLASLVYPIIELDISQIANFNHKAITLGFFASFIVGYLCIKYFMKLLGQLSLKMFGGYCLGASCLMYLLFQFFYHQQ